MPASFTITFVPADGVSEQDVNNVKEFFKGWFGKNYFDDKFNQQLQNTTNHFIRTIDASLTNADTVVLPGWAEPCLRDNHKPTPDSKIINGT